jgi:hypothetical protein
MVMGFVGADVSELEVLAGVASQVAERLRVSRAGVRRVVHTSAWGGDDAERFRVDFDRRVGPSMELVADLLDQTSVAVRRNAHEQRTASTDAPIGHGGATSAGSVSPHAVHAGDWLMEGLILEGLDKGLLLGELTGALDRVPWLGPLGDAVQVTYYTKQYGFWSNQNEIAMLDVLGGTIATAAWGPLGAAGWAFASDGAENLGQSIGSAYFERHYGMTRAELEVLADSGDVQAGTVLGELGTRSLASLAGDWAWSLWN